MISVVQKPFVGAGRQFTTGEVVDSTGWRLERQLLAQRRLRAAKPEEVERATSSESRGSGRGKR